MSYNPHSVQDVFGVELSSCQLKKCCPTCRIHTRILRRRFQVIQVPEDTCLQSRCQTSEASTLLTSDRTVSQRGMIYCTVLLNEIQITHHSSEFFVRKLDNLSIFLNKWSVKTMVAGKNFFAKMNRYQLLAISQIDLSCQVMTFLLV